MRASPWDKRRPGAGVRSEWRGRQRFPWWVQLAKQIARASSAPLTVTPRRCQNASKESGRVGHASETLDRERFEAGASSASGTREPRGRSEVDRVYRARRSANLKTCKQLRATYFYEACTSATRADATGVKSASAASESVLGPGIPVFYGGCLFHDRILGPATRPSDRWRA